MLRQGKVHCGVRAILDSVTSSEAGENPADNHKTGDDDVTDAKN